jgi:hypothetical protein
MRRSKVYSIKFFWTNHSIPKRKSTFFRRIKPIYEVVEFLLGNVTWYDDLVHESDAKSEPILRV